VLQLLAVLQLAQVLLVPVRQAQVQPLLHWRHPWQEQQHLGLQAL
jgi:hypothetical protein